MSIGEGIGQGLMFLANQISGKRAEERAQKAKMAQYQQELAYKKQLSEEERAIKKQERELQGQALAPLLQGYLPEGAGVDPTALGYLGESALAGTLIKSKAEQAVEQAELAKKQAYVDSLPDTDPSKPFYQAELAGFKSQTALNPYKVDQLLAQVSKTKADTEKSQAQTGYTQKRTALTGQTKGSSKTSGLMAPIKIDLSGL